jgi:glycosyltransferase involved in cell wall biosynthesis
VTIDLCLLGDASSVHTQRWAREMLARNFKVSLITARPQALDGVEQRVLSPVKRSVDWLLRVGEVRRHLRELAPDIVHAHYITSYGYLAARCKQRPLVMTAWGSDILVSPVTSALIRRLTRWTLRHADLLTGDSRDLVEAMLDHTPGSVVEQVHWGADMTRFRPSSWTAKTGFHIASLRSWEPNYRIETIIESAALFHHRHPEADMHIHLLGGGPQEGALRSRVEALGIGARVSLHGRLDDAGMTAVLDQCKVSISIPVSDATSVSLLESMACALPVIASDLPANREWLAGQEELILPNVDKEPVAGLLADLWRDQEKAKALGVRNLDRMRRDGSRSAQMDRMAALYATLLGQWRNAGNFR